ncbi:MAG: acetate/propionate family kinase [Candidatus Aminicenantes bacterium]|nr:acetate/propionate family kinase [Candidatus Aminicenantes bacterium]
MKILVINTGSSSIKYQFFNMNQQKAIAAGLAEKIGEQTSVLTHELLNKKSRDQEKIEKGKICNHEQGMTRIVNLLIDPEWGVIKDKAEIDAVGHRVVHGGESFQSSTIISDEVISAIEENIPLAPLHNPPNLTGIKVAQSLFPDAPQVAVFDTAFHQSIPEKAYLYAVPYELYQKHKVRRYGFHGTSHEYVAQEGARFLKRSLEDLNLITVHLGNGASMAAVKNGKCMDTTMGLTPLEGLVMGTRSGDIDPALPFFLAKNLDLSVDEIDDLLNKKSGLKGLCGINDMREIEQRAASGDLKARMALDVYALRIKKYIGAYYAELGRLDAVIFTAGIGENSPQVRGMCCEGLEELGMRLDEKKNKVQTDETREIHTPDSRVNILVVPTNEEKKIALETEKVIRWQSHART